MTDIKEWFEEELREAEAHNKEVNPDGHVPVPPAIRFEAWYFIDEFAHMVRFALGFLPDNMPRITWYSNKQSLLFEFISLHTRFSAFIGEDYTHVVHSYWDEELDAPVARETEHSDRNLAATIIAGFYVAEYNQSHDRTEGG